MQTDSFLSNSPQLRALYCQFMAQTEPDLLPENVPLLLEKYKDETPDAREERKKRYAAALTEVHNFITFVTDTMKQNIQDFQREILQMAENRDNVSDKNAMQSLDASIQQS